MTEREMPEGQPAEPSSVPEAADPGTAVPQSDGAHADEGGAGAGFSDTQIRLLEAALLTIEEVGIQNTTTRLIAERAGVNLQLIQYHFGGKAGLIKAAESYILDRFFEEVGPAVAAAPDLAGAIRAGVDATWQLAQEKPAHVQPDMLLQSLRVGGEAPGARGPRKTQLRVKGMLAAVMERTGERLSVPLDDFTALVVSGLSGLVLEYRTSGDEGRVGRAMGLFSTLLASCVEPAPKDVGA